MKTITKPEVLNSKPTTLELEIEEITRQIELAISETETCDESIICEPTIPYNFHSMFSKEAIYHCQKLYEEAGWRVKFKRPGIFEDHRYYYYILER